MKLNDGLPNLLNTESRFTELSFDQLFLYYEMKGIKLNRKTFKTNLELLTKDGKYNMMAQLLSDDPHIPIRFAVFNGKDKTSTMYAVREYGNMCLLLSLDKVLDYGDTLNDCYSFISVRKPGAAFPRLWKCTARKHLILKTMPLW